MSDANKAMIDASGRLIRGATHPYVLADDLYPMVPTQSYIWGYRGGTVPGQWDADWETYDLGFEPSANYYFGTGADHTAISIPIGTNTIDWARVKKITWKIDALSLVIPAGLTVKVTKSKNNSTFPAGTVIRDDWDTVAAYTETSDVTLTIEWDIDGVEPTSLEFALMFTDDVGVSEGEGSALTTNLNPQARIVYNLATA
jgi:hypothetical protein